MSRAPVHQDDSVKEKQKFLEGQNRPWKCFLCGGLPLRENALQKRAADQNSWQQALFLKQPKESLTHADVTRCVRMNGSRPPKNPSNLLCVRFLQKRESPDRNYRSTASLFALAHLRLQHSHFFSRRNFSALHRLAQYFFMFGDCL